MLDKSADIAQSRNRANRETTKLKPRGWPPRRSKTRRAPRSAPTCRRALASPIAVTRIWRTVLGGQPARMDVTPASPPRARRPRTDRRRRGSRDRRGCRRARSPVPFPASPLTRLPRLCGPRIVPEGRVPPSRKRSLSHRYFRVI